MSECVIWGGATNGRGYGRVGYKVDGRQPLAHVLAWEMAHGPVPPDLQLHHVCEVALCVNVEHLRLVTVDEHATMHPQSQPRERCVRGHPLTPANRVPNGRSPRGAQKWTCRVCKNARRRVAA